MTAESKSAMAENLLTFLDNITAAALQENLDMLKRFVREATNSILREAFVDEEKPSFCYYPILLDTKDKALDTRIESAEEALIGDQAKREVMRTSVVVARGINRLAMAVQAAIAGGKYDKEACLSVVIAAKALCRVTALYSGWSDNCSCFQIIELAEQGEDYALTIHSHFSVRNTTYIRLYGYGDDEIKKIMYSQPHKNVMLIGRWANTHNPGVQFIYLLGTSYNDYCIVKEDGKFELYRMKEEFAEKYQFGYPPPEAIAEVLARK